MKLKGTIILLLVTRVISAQICFDVKTIEDHKKFETSISSAYIGELLYNPYFDTQFEDLYLNKQFPVLDNNPVVFIRENDSFKPSLSVWLFTNIIDSVKLIIYKWSYFDLSNRPEIMREQTLRFHDYKEKYDTLFTEISKQFGKPKPSQLTNSNLYYYECTTWDETKMRIVLEMRFDKTIQSTSILPGDWYISLKILFKEPNKA